MPLNLDNRNRLLVGFGHYLSLHFGLHGHICPKSAFLIGMPLVWASKEVPFVKITREAYASQTVTFVILII